MNSAELLQLAATARLAAYAPYSKFQVGAALLTKSGKVFTGCNVENASYGLTICAERSAVFQAIAAGEHEFERIAISLQGGGSPCGACRQVLHEFAPGLPVDCGDESGNPTKTLTLAELLPEAFGPKSLDV